MDIFLIVVVCVLAVLLLFAMCLLVVIYGHPDDKNQAKLPKLITVMGLWIAFASLLILPYDVANSKGGGGGVRVDLLWQIIYITLAVFITFLIPFAFFYYESDMDEEEAAEAGFCDSQCGNGLKYTFAFAVFFIVVMVIMFTQLGTATVPVRRLAQSRAMVRSFDPKYSLYNFYDINQPYQAASNQSLSQFPLIFSSALDLYKSGSCVKQSDFNSATSLAASTGTSKVIPGCVTSTFYWNIQVTFPVYIIAFIAFIGWWFFCMFAGVGFFALPIDLINEFRTRPTPISTKAYFEERASMGSRAKQLLNIAEKLQQSMDKAGKSRSQRNQDSADMRALEKHYYFLKKDYQILYIAHKLKGGNPLEYFAKLIFGIICAILSLCWFIHIGIFVLPRKPVYSFLNGFFIILEDNVPGFPLFGVLAFAIFAFYLLWCTIKGNFRLGLRFLFFKIYPMEVGNTLMNAFLANTWIMMLCAIPATQFCVTAFPYYTRNTTATVMFGNQIQYLKFFIYFFSNNVFIIMMLCFSALTAIFLCICPTNKADAIEKELDRIAKSSGTSLQAHIDKDED